jgi:hypothetical protein
MAFFRAFSTEKLIKKTDKTPFMIAGRPHRLCI